MWKKPVEKTFAHAEECKKNLTDNIKHTHERDVYEIESNLDWPKDNCCNNIFIFPTIAVLLIHKRIDKCWKQTWMFCEQQKHKIVFMPTGI